MVSGHKYVGRVGEAEIGKSLPDMTQILIGILDRGERGRAIDAGRQLVKAVTLIVLRAVWVARPKDKNERMVACFEERQHDFGRDIDEIVLLHSISHGGAGRCGGAGLAVLAARGCG